jgi:hypothetical protein
VIGEFCCVGLTGKLLASLPSGERPGAGLAGSFRGLMSQGHLSIWSAKIKSSFRRGFAAQSMFSPPGLLDEAVRLNGYNAQVH